MPRGNRTGPEGYGPATGRGLGFCAGHNSPGYTYPAPGRGMGMNNAYGRGFGRGFGAGRGFRGYGGLPNEQLPTKEEELSILKTQADNFERNLEDIRKRIDELKENQK